MSLEPRNGLSETIQEEENLLFQDKSFKIKAEGVNRPYIEETDKLNKNNQNEKEETKGHIEISRKESI
jgi:hypothetical protein